MDDKLPMVFEDLPVGEEYVDEYVLTPEMARDYAEGIEDPNPWHLEHSPFGGPVANPILIVRSTLACSKPSTSLREMCIRATRPSF
jgi:acyl dehydratase